MRTRSGPDSVTVTARGVCASMRLPSTSKNDTTGPAPTALPCTRTSLSDGESILRYAELQRPGIDVDALAAVGHLHARRGGGGLFESNVEAPPLVRCQVGLPIQQTQRTLPSGHRLSTRVCSGVTVFASLMLRPAALRRAPGAKGTPTVIGHCTRATPAGSRTSRVSACAGSGVA